MHILFVTSFFIYDDKKNFPMPILPFKKNYYQHCSSVRCREDGSICMIDLDSSIPVFNAAPPEDIKDHSIQCSSLLHSTFRNFLGFDGIDYETDDEFYA